ncbi:hypothetical protein QEV83_16200 [Methylocapsa sp. D3K7]|uniref:hypothetical protein n=1 Tax=Methylocapsa sp. D3K7 TaxID=3041435 RepID=UPI00244E5E43|nr:hypothetical protein [Methylocapsa sp. D3K7]WGJ14171.1 hypothetical protein QEV83_16200 [Methylocapsa sp. D3K7]
MRILGAFLQSLHRFGLAALGPVAVSATQFLLQMDLLRTLETTEFGLFAFIVGFIQFGFGLSNALVCTPYTVWINNTQMGDKDAQTYFKVNLALSAIWAAFCIIIVMTLGRSVEAWFFGLFGFLAMIRWFGRAHLYAIHRPTTVVISDFIFAGVLLMCISSVPFASLSLLSAIAMLCVATTGGVIAIGLAFIEMQFRRAWVGSFRDYGDVWRDHARWTLLGVVSSEATANAHSYVVTLHAGPAAFAPIAAATLLVKPISLIITSLTQLERPVMARHLASGDMTAALQSVAFFRLAVILTWTGTISAGVACLVWFPRLLFSPSYDIGTLKIAFFLWAWISLLQSWSTPPSVLLQAAQWFKPLGSTGVASAVVAVIAVLAFALVLTPVYTLIGILIGQAIMNWGIAILKTRWMAGCDGITFRHWHLRKPSGSMV